MATEDEENRISSDVVDEAFEAVRTLAPERREELARYMLRRALNNAEPGRRAGID